MFDGPKRNLAEAFGHAYESSRKKRIELQVQDNEYVQQMRAALNHYKGRCAYCAGLDDRSEACHSLPHCPKLSGHFGRYREFRQAIRYGANHGSICWLCHVPQCNDRLHVTFTRGSSAACEHPDVIVPVVHALLQSTERRERAIKGLGQAWMDDMQLMEWINGKPLVNHESNLTALFLGNFQSLKRYS
jgi:hypothetical protein